LIRSFVGWVSVPLAISVVAGTVTSFVDGRWILPAWFVAILLLAMWSLALLTLAARALFRKNWEIVGALFCSLLLSPSVFFVGTKPGNYIHLAMMLPYYSIEVRRQPDWQSKPVRFYWGDKAVWVLDGSQPTWLVYDVSGKTAAGNNQAHDGDNFPGYSLDTRHLVGNYYLSTYHSP
jgi:hypothetical protein